MTGDFKTQLQFWLNGSTLPATSVLVAGQRRDDEVDRDARRRSCSLGGRGARATAIALPAALLLVAGMGLGLSLRRRREAVGGR